MGGAKLLSFAKRSGKGDKPMALKDAEKLDATTPTGQFELGRARMDHHSVQIRALQGKLSVINEELVREGRTVRDKYGARIRQLSLLAKGRMARG